MTAAESKRATSDVNVARHKCRLQPPAPPLIASNHASQVQPKGVAETRDGQDEALRETTATTITPSSCDIESATPDACNRQKCEKQASEQQQRERSANSQAQELTGEQEPGDERQQHLRDDEQLARIQQPTQRTDQQQQQQLQINHQPHQHLNAYTHHTNHHHHNYQANNGQQHPHFIQYQAPIHQAAGQPQQAHFLPMCAPNGHYSTALVGAHSFAYPAGHQFFWSQHPVAYQPAGFGQPFCAPPGQAHMIVGQQQQHHHAQQPFFHSTAPMWPTVYAAQQAAAGGGGAFACGHDVLMVGAYEISPPPFQQQQHYATEATSPSHTTGGGGGGNTDAANEPGGHRGAMSQAGSERDDNEMTSDSSSSSGAEDDEGAAAVEEAADSLGRCVNGRPQRRADAMGDVQQDECGAVDAHQASAIVQQLDKISYLNCPAQNKRAHEHYRDCRLADSRGPSQSGVSSSPPPPLHPGGPPSAVTQMSATAHNTSSASVEIEPGQNISSTRRTSMGQPGGAERRAIEKEEAEVLVNGVSCQMKSCISLGRNLATARPTSGPSACQTQTAGAVAPEANSCLPVDLSEKSAELSTKQATSGDIRIRSDDTMSLTSERDAAANNCLQASGDTRGVRNIMASRSSNLRLHDRRQARVTNKQQQQQQQQQPANQISINGTTFYNVPSGALQRVGPMQFGAYHQHQHQFNSQHLLLPYHPQAAATYHNQGSFATAAHYYQQQQQQATLALPHFYYSHPSSTSMTLGSHHQPTATATQAFYQHQAALAHAYELQHALAYQVPNSSILNPAQHQQNWHQNQPHHNHHHGHQTNNSGGGLNVGFSQLKLGYNLIPLLPIDASPTRIRQAYGMDKVWQDEFELLFSKFVSSVVWTLVEVETVPNVRNTSRILSYKGRFIVRVGSTNDDHCHSSSATSSVTAANTPSSCASSGTRDCVTPARDANDDSTTSDVEEDEDEEDDECVSDDADKALAAADSDQNQSDCDSGAVLNSSTSTNSSSETTANSPGLADCSSSSDEAKNTCAPNQLETQSAPVVVMAAGGGGSAHNQGVHRKFPLRFKMFIDSAKVRFCCDNCGHGWTSMKGRVVFWYELFELVDHSDGISNLIGYCAYKLFGQQCDVCKVENRFERPMWYPEEVTKVLANLYNKIGQVYFGFKMPAIDKQRRAGKPKTSHNSLLCQACHDGVCTDRK